MVSNDALFSGGEAGDVRSARGGIDGKPNLGDASEEACQTMRLQRAGGLLLLPDGVGEGWRGADGRFCGELRLRRTRAEGDRVDISGSAKASTLRHGEARSGSERR